MTDHLCDRSIVLGVTGSIAAYKSLEIASRLAQAGALVDVIMTRSALELVRPMAFQALTHRPVVTDLWSPVGPAALDHVTIARGADLFAVAPVTADTIARLALGRADDALTTTALATRAPMLLAPAMEPNMWSHPATQASVRVLEERGAVLVGPEVGRMASGITGLGRMADPASVISAMRWLLAGSGPWAGRRILVTAGPTREPLDPVRYLSNYSSGRMGLALASAARDRGARVDLVHGPIEVPAEAGVESHPVETAEEMCAAVLRLLDAADALIMTAAIADFRPAARADQKIKKSDQPLDLRLARTPDVLLEVRRALAGRSNRPVIVGFAAETDSLVENARAKLFGKGLDLVVANPVPQTFGAAEAAVTLVDALGVTHLTPRSKADVADAVLDRVDAVWHAANQTGAAAAAERAAGSDGRPSSDGQGA